MKKIPPLEGRIKRHPDGFGFFIPFETEFPDAYVPQEKMRGVMTGDKVIAHLDVQFGSRDKLRATSLEIVSRNFKFIVGRVRQLSRNAFLLPDISGSWGSECRILSSPNFPVEDGDWLKVKITNYPPKLQGEIIEKIGSQNDAFIDNKRVLLEHGIPLEFPDSVLKELESIEEKSKNFSSSRKDLRDTSFVTVDGEHAKDFDDAIFVSQSKEGFELKVAIADVSHFVKPGSTLNEEAYKRANSTYLPHFVNPMLPSVLSDELCSLKPDVERLAFVCDMKFNFQGELKGEALFYEARIRSHKRFTYGEVSRILDEKKSNNSLEDMIHKASDLAHLFLKARIKNGSLDLDIPEVVVSVSEAGETLDIFSSPRLFSHRMIEEFMLQANQAAARVLSQKDTFSVHRIHEPPEEKSLFKLQSFLKSIGIKDKVRNQKQLRAVSRKEEEGSVRSLLINQLILRSMSQARYSSQTLGHYALNFTHYTHFTSPIRRYADLIVHRCLKQALGIDTSRALSQEDLETVAQNISACEQRSVKVERKVEGIKKARFMSQHLGKEFEGVITSITKNGLFVRLREWAVDGFVSVDDLRETGLKFDSENMRLFSKKSSKEYIVGQKAYILVASIDIDQGFIDFTMSYKKKDKKNKKFYKNRKQNRIRKK